MKVVITGSSGLAKVIGDVIVSTNDARSIHIVSHVRVEQGIDWNSNDAFINCAHVGFEQTTLLMKAYNQWKNDDSKTIINISSRAVQPNISKGYLYASQKASLNHLSNNLVYNSEKKCRITTMNLGLLNHKELPSISYNEVATWIYNHLTASKHFDIPEITIQNGANYLDVQNDKQSLRELEILSLNMNNPK